MTNIRWHRERRPLLSCGVRNGRQKFYIRIMIGLRRYYNENSKKRECVCVGVCVGGGGGGGRKYLPQNNFLRSTEINKITI